MPTSWPSELWRLVLSVLFFGFLGTVFGHPHIGLFSGSVVYVLYFWRRFAIFEKWVNGPIAEPEYLGGIFDNIAFRIFRLRQRSRKRKKRMSELLRRWQDSSGTLPDATVVINNNGTIAWFNLTASSMLGLKQSDTGQHITNLIRNPRFVHFIREADYNEQMEIPSPMDVSRVLNVRMSAYGNKQHLLLVSDVTHLRRLMTMRRDFVANVSHELRTPLTVIMGYLESLKEEDSLDHDAIDQYMGRLEPSARRMKSLVEDLLMLSSLDTEAPASVESSELVSIGPMVRNICGEAEQLSGGRHTFQCHIDDHLRLRGVDKEIYSAFMNLVSNAVRYTPEGTEVDIVWEMHEEGARFCVRDNGPGIQPEHIPRLTERFYRVDVGRSRQTGGTGLGLAIVKQVLRRHDAQLDIDSTVGKGSSFCCQFPAARIQGLEEPPASNVTYLSS